MGIDILSNKGSANENLDIPTLMIIPPGNEENFLWFGKMKTGNWHYAELLQQHDEDNYEENKDDNNDKVNQQIDEDRVSPPPTSIHRRLSSKE